MKLKLKDYDVKVVMRLIRIWTYFRQKRVYSSLVVPLKCYYTTKEIIAPDIVMYFYKKEEIITRLNN